MAFNRLLFGGIFWAFVSLLAMSCSKPANTTPELLPFSPGALPDGFQYKNSHTVTLTLNAQDKRGGALRAPNIIVFAGHPNNRDTVACGAIGFNGTYTVPISIGNHITRLYVLTNYVGLLDTIILSVGPKINAVTQSLLPDTGYKAMPDTNARFAAPQTAGSGYNTIGPWDKLGVPYYKKPIDDYYYPTLAAAVYNTMPEGRSVSKNASVLFRTNTDLLLTPDSTGNGTANITVSVGFVHDGTGKKNSLAYYTYDRGAPPSTSSQLKKKLKTIIWPNASFAGAGGGLYTGNSVVIGSFPPNTGIGWVLLPDGFKNGLTLPDTTTAYYSNSLFNPENNPDLRRHSLLLNDGTGSRFILGFEDGNRALVSTDNDFNDAVFCITTSTQGSVDASDLPEVLPVKDNDSDGIPDLADQYPDNPKMAYNNYTPSPVHYGTICFEDGWPATGDYDFNDLAIAYNFNLVTNSSNMVVQVNTRIKIVGSGATYRNGFGFSFKLPPSAITKLKDKTPAKTFQYPARFNVDAITGTENSQTFATILVYDSPELFVHRTGGGYFNTQELYPRGASNEISFKLELGVPTDFGSLGTPPYNPFIFTNKGSVVPYTRGTEIHLPDEAPTSLMNKSLFGTLQDKSNPLAGLYFRATNNAPFALAFPVEWRWPLEKTPVTDAYLHFVDWAASNGSRYPDWYLNTPANVLESNVYDR